MTDHQTARRLAALDQVLILTHRRPDGDTIGCASALCLMCIRDRHLPDVRLSLHPVSF